MASTEDRVRSLIAANLEVDAGVSSMDIVSFARVVQDEFGVTIGLEQCNELKTLGQLIDYIDANAA